MKSSRATALLQAQCFLAVVLAMFFVSVQLGPPTLAQTRPQPRPSAKPQPLDPLTAEEKKVGEQVALEDSRVRELLGTGRRKLVSVSLFTLKPPSAERQPDTGKRPAWLGRFAEVLFFRYEDESGVRAVVDLDHRKVTEAGRVESRDVPLDDTDVAEALDLALRDSEATKALGKDASRFRGQAKTAAGVSAGAYVVQGQRILGAEKSDPCWSHRCLRLLFRKGDVYLSEPIVLVDLTAQKVTVERREQ
jgi:Cu2+-containing amine oxidase